MRILYERANRRIPDYKLRNRIWIAIPEWWGLLFCLGTNHARRWSLGGRCMNGVHMSGNKSCTSSRYAVRFSLCTSFCLYVILSVRHSVCTSFCLYVTLPVRHSVCTFLFMYVILSVRHSVCTLLCLYVTICTWLCMYVTLVRHSDYKILFLYVTLFLRCSVCTLLLTVRHSDCTSLCV